MKSLIVYLAILLIAIAGFWYIKPRVFTTDGQLELAYRPGKVYQLQTYEVPAVTHYLKENLGDWESYESIEWGVLDSIGRNENGEKSYLVSHKFRSGGKLSDLEFEITESGRITHTETYQERDLRLKKEEARKMIQEEKIKRGL